MSKIIFCDSGISKEQSGYVESYDIGYGVYDENGHGTSLIDLVHRINEKIEFKSIKMLDENNEGTLDGLINALNKCIEMDGSVICLALSIDGTINENKELQETVERVVERGKIIVAALHNEASYSIPAGFRNVIGVKTIGISSKTTRFYDVTQPIQCELPTENFFCKSLDGEYVKFGGNSVACAFFAEHIASILKNNKEYRLPEIQTCVAGQKITDVEYYSFFDYLVTHSEHEYEIRKKIMDVTKQCNLDQFDNHILMAIKSMRHLNHYLKELEKNGLEINKKTFLRKYDLQTVSTLTNYFMVQNNISNGNGGNG